MQVLKEIGLTASEERVYMSLLDLGDSTRGAIVNKSGVAGSKVYELLEKLQEKGLISSYLKNKIKHFKPTNPKQILHYLENKKKHMSAVEKEAKNLVTNLLAKYNSSKKNQEIELASGLNGLEVIFREQIEMLSGGDICYVIGGTRGSDEENVQDFFEKIHAMRKEKGIKTRMLFNKKQRESTSQRYSSKRYPGTETRYISHTSPVAINVYKNVTVIIIFGSELSAISITSQEVANSFLEYFNLMWKIGEK